MTKMKILLLALALCTGLTLGIAGPAMAQTPQQVQGLIASGQSGQALQDLKTILRDHPQSGVAWYLTAEAQDAAGNVSAARAALAKAEQFSPGLRFASGNDVAALKAHLANPGRARAVAAHGGGISPAVWVIGGLVVLFLIMRFFPRRRFGGAYGPGAYGNGYPHNPNGPHYGPGGPGYGPGYGYGGGMMGGGIGSAVVGGLAAGAGFAAGERIIDGMMGGERGAGMGQGPVIDPSAAGPLPSPDWDDGLQGNPGWDDNGGGFDGGGGDLNNNSW